jgi:hypothetical protein
VYANAMHSLLRRWLSWPAVGCWRVTSSCALHVVMKQNLLRRPQYICGIDIHIDKGVAFPRLVFGTGFGEAYFGDPTSDGHILTQEHLNLPLCEVRVGRGKCLYDLRLHVRCAGARSLPCLSPMDSIQKETKFRQVECGSATHALFQQQRHICTIFSSGAVEHSSLICRHNPSGSSVPLGSPASSPGASALPLMQPFI